MDGISPLLQLTDTSLLVALVLPFLCLPVYLEEGINSENMYGRLHLIHAGVICIREKKSSLPSSVLNWDLRSPESDLMHYLRHLLCLSSSFVKQGFPQCHWGNERINKDCDSLKHCDNPDHKYTQNVFILIACSITLHIRHRESPSMGMC